MGQRESVDREWRIRIGEVFDLDEARRCMRHCREHPPEGPASLVFDLSETRSLYTAGIGAMLHLKSCYGVRDGDAAIIYRHGEVGELLRLVRLDRAFRLLEAGGSRPSGHAAGMGDA
ncbi:MAG: STAS domain-containing protein [Pseudomonadota bacterium]